MTVPELPSHDSTFLGGRRRASSEPTRFVVVLCPRCLEPLEVPHPWDTGKGPPYRTGCPACGSPGELRVQTSASGVAEDFFFEPYRARLRRPTRERRAAGQRRFEESSWDRRRRPEN